jgi:hypothetical protein
MDTTATSIGSEWAARRLAVRWGIQHRPSGRWVVFGSEARCRSLVAHLAEADAILTGAPAPPARTPGPLPHPEAAGARVRGDG